MTRDGHWDKFNDDETELVGLKFKDYYINHNKFMNIIEADDIDKIL